jgi:hypothetical protein
LDRKTDPGMALDVEEYMQMELNFRSPEFTIQSMKLPKVASVAMMYMISIVDSISHCFQIPVPV